MQCVLYYVCFSPQRAPIEKTEGCNHMCCKKVGRVNLLIINFEKMDGTYDALFLLAVQARLLLGVFGQLGLPQFIDRWLL